MHASRGDKEAAWAVGPCVESIVSISYSQTMLRTPSGPSTDGGSDRQKRLQIYRPVAIMWTLCVLGMLPDISGTHAVRGNRR